MGNGNQPPIGDLLARAGVDNPHMSEFDAFEIKMRAAGMGDAPVAVFKRNYEALLRNETGMIAEETISPADGLPKADDLEIDSEADLLGQVAIVKLNGGLGTGMGLQGPKESSFRAGRGEFPRSHGQTNARSPRIQREKCEAASHE